MWPHATEPLAPRADASRFRAARGVGVPDRVLPGQIGVAPA